jgi:hypothetical protein
MRWRGHVPPCPCLFVFQQMLTHTRGSTHSCTHARAHTHTHTRTHTHTHARTHTRAQQVQQFLLFCELELAPPPPGQPLLTVHGLILSAAGPGPAADADAAADAADAADRPWRPAGRAATAALLRLAAAAARPGEPAHAAYLRLVGREASPSRLQRDVAAALAAAGAGAGLQAEAVDPAGGYSIDVLLPRAAAAAVAGVPPDAAAAAADGGRPAAGGSGWVAVEVDGPFHYAVGTRRPLGSTVREKGRAGGGGDEGGGGWGRGGGRGGR